MVSFAQIHGPIVAEKGVSVEWAPHLSKYTLRLGWKPDDPLAIRVHLETPDVRTVITSLIAAMAARGEAVQLPDETPADAVALDNAAADLAEITREVEFLYPTQDLGPRLRTILARLGYVAEPTIDASEDYAVDRERDRVVGL